jgi:hypothetical protein
MLWFTLWFMVILKIPILYLAWVIWWAVKDPPEAYAGPAGSELGSGGGPGWRPALHRDRVRRPRGGPHGSPRRRAARVPFARTRARGS